MEGEREEQARKESAAMSTTTAQSMTSTAASMSVRTSVSIGTKPTLIDVAPMNFLIMDAPRQGNLHVYIKEMRKLNVTEVVRVCEPTYGVGELNSAGINLHEMEYKDGTSPPKELIMAWLQLVEKTFYSPTSSTAVTNATTAMSTTAAAADPQKPNGSNGNRNTNCIAVHCVAGLGRAPVMVAIALIEFANMDPVEAVSFIRGRRRGAINEKQLLYLEGYKKQYKKGGAGGGADTGCSCVIS
jgi:protein tyrosine phosphatase type IVA